MIKLLFLLLIILVSAWIGVYLQHDPGYLLITFHKWSIETTLTVALIGFILFTYLLHISFNFFHWFLKIPQSLHNWRTKRKIQNARSKTRQGLIEFSEGYWSKAKNHLINALPDTDTPLLNYLTAARAAQELGDNKLRDDYLREAQQSMPEAKIAVELTQAQLQLANKQWEQALATLKHLQLLNPNHPYVLKLLMHLYEQIRDWSQLIELLPELKSNKVISSDEFSVLEENAYIQRIKDLIRLNQSENLTNLIAKLPKDLRHSHKIIALYSTYLITKEKTTKAESLLRKELHKNFSKELIEIYSHLNEKGQLEFAETLLTNNSHSAELFLCLSRLSKKAGLWGKARTYIDENIKIKPTPIGYAELGNLLEILHDPKGACIAFKKGLLLEVRDRVF